MPACAAVGHDPFINLLTTVDATPTWQFAQIPQDFLGSIQRHRYHIALATRTCPVLFRHQAHVPTPYRMRFILVSFLRNSVTHACTVIKSRAHGLLGNDSVGDKEFASGAMQEVFCPTTNGSVTFHDIAVMHPLGIDLA